MRKYSARLLTLMPKSSSTVKDVGEIITHRRDIIHAVGNGHDLVVGAIFAELFKAVMEVADLRDAADNTLAIQFKHEPQGAVGGGMGRPEIEEHAFFLRLVDEIVKIGFGLFKFDAIFFVHALSDSCLIKPRQRPLAAAGP